MYHLTMKRRTTIDLDIDLEREARRVLGTTRMTDTIHRAMAEAVARERRRWLAEYEFPDLTPERLDTLRRDRVEIDDWTHPDA